MASTAHNTRKNRESLSKRLGATARKIKDRDGRRCAYCPNTEACELAAGRHMHLDHLVPKAAGGLDIPENLVVACHRCNSARQNMSLAQWAAYARVTYGLSFSPAKIRAQARKELN